MDVLIVSLAALLASGLTLFSGFGLGTLLMPVMAIFFPLEVAIAMTAVVHLANNLFKVVLLGRQADPGVLLRFGIPAVAAAFMGALVLGWLSGLPVLSYSLWGQTHHLSPLKGVVGGLILAFVALELTPGANKRKLDRKYLPLGGAISGFFGGLSGHQGAFRSMFLLKAGLDKQAFVATGVMLAVMVDLSRMLVYGQALTHDGSGVDWPLVIVASLAAFTGAFVGKKLLTKITIRTIQVTVSALLVVVSLGLISGIL